MEDVFKHWWIVQRAAEVAALFLLLAVIYLRKELIRERTEHKALRARFDGVQEERIEDGKNMALIVERNAVAQEGLATLIRDRRERG